MRLLFFFIAAILLLPLASADLSCSIVPEGSCGDTAILRMENDTGGFNNAHAQLPSYSGNLYNHEICCESTGQDVTTSCDGSEFLRLSDEDDAHVQVVDETLNTETYEYPACIDGLGSSVCLSTEGSPPGDEDYECLGSIASSEENDGDYNLTNAHIASCDYYDLNVYCFLNSPPTHDDPLLEASSPDNTTLDDLTVTPQNPQDPDGHEITFTYEWRRDGEEYLSSPDIDDTLSSEETSPGDVWTVLVTPNDGWDDGESKLSNPVVIEAAALDVPELVYPVNESITNRYPVFNWTDVEQVGNELYYELEVQAPSGLGCFDIEEFNILESELESSEELCTDLDYTGNYQWRVRACNDIDCSDWTSYAWFEVNSVNMIEFIEDEVDFGVLEVDSVVNTSDGNPSPFRVRNSGNIRINITGYASEDLFDTVGLNEENFLFRVREADANAFDASLENYSPVPDSAEFLVGTLKYLEGEREFLLDLGVMLPPEEPAGVKTTQIILSSTPDNPS